MAELKGVYKVKNDSGNYDIVYLKTLAEQVVENANKRFVSDSEKSTWNNKANSNHNHDSVYAKLAGSTITGNFTFNNNVGVLGKNGSGTTYDIAKINSSNQTILGNTGLQTILTSSANPKAKVGSNEYVLYHTGNKPSATDVGAYSKTEADSRYKLKSDLVFTDTISIVTPAT